MCAMQDNAKLVILDPLSFQTNKEHERMCDDLAAHAGMAIDAAHNIKVVPPVFVSFV